jgi:predicted dehydrogenase
MRLRVGVVGCGFIAQVKHLPLLRELPDRYELAALCDLSEEVVRACAQRFGVERTFTSWEDLLAEPLDAVWVLTGGSHAPIVTAAAKAGLHAFIEKPLCFSTAEGRELVAEVRAAGVHAMVGYMKRYDPAYRQLAQGLSRLDDLRLVRVTTLEAPQEPYVAHLPLIAGKLPDGLVQELRADDLQRLRRAIGDVDELTERTYRIVLLDSLVHELNTLRGLLGEPDSIEWAEIHPHGVNAALRFDGVPCTLSWIDLPGLAHYEQEFAFYGPAARAALTFSSPFLPNVPGRLTLEGGKPGTARAWRQVETVSYEDPFKLELLEFHDMVARDLEPLTTVEDALRDVELCERIVRRHLGDE